jgi:anaerobic magnesium-protoporphyrin IX monomethyl ester cyclase
MGTRIVLINPGMNVHAGFGPFAGLMEPMPCIGIAYLAASLKKAGHDVLCVDAFAENLSPEALLARIDAFGARWVGQTCLTPTALATFAFNRLLKERRPEIRTVLGNVHASVFGPQIIERGQADYVLEGECEHSLPRFLDLVEEGKSLDEVPGLHRLSDAGRPECSGPAVPVPDLDALPRPDWSDLPWRRYTFLPFVTVARPALAIMGSRGCPYRCTFCALGYQGRYRLRSPEGIVEEMAILVRDFDARHIGFVDPIFPLSKSHLLALCARIRERRFPKRVTWTSETRVDTIDPEMMAEMKSAGVRRLLFGVESGSDRMLEAVQKGYTVAAVRRCIGWAREIGLETSCFFILGLPGETRQESLKTARLPIELDIDFAKFSVLVPLPGSQLYMDLVENGRLRTDDWTKFTTFNPRAEDLPYVPEGMTGEELLRLQNAANVRFYFRPRMIFRHLFVIRTIPIRRMAVAIFYWLSWKVKAGLRSRLAGASPGPAS